MTRHDAVKALNIYKRAGQQVYNNDFLQAFSLMTNMDWVLWSITCWWFSLWILCRLKILLTSMNTAKAWTLLGISNFQHWDRFLLFVRVSLMCYHDWKNLTKLFTLMNSHLPLSLQQWKNTLKKHHRQAMLIRKW